MSEVSLAMNWIVKIKHGAMKGWLNERGNFTFHKKDARQFKTRKDAEAEAKRWNDKPNSSSQASIAAGRPS